MVPAIILVVLLVSLAAYSISFHWAPSAEDKVLKKAGSGAQILSGLITTVGIVTAALLYIMEKTWSPRFAVDLKAATYLLPKGDPQKAIVQAVIAITNQGRTSQTVSNIEVGAIDIARAGMPDISGDVLGKVVFHFTSTKIKEIGPGETDVGFVEIPVSCERSLVRILVKVPRPPFDANAPKGTRMVYQRKVFVPVEADCTRLANPLGAINGQGLGELKS